VDEKELDKKSDELAQYIFKKFDKNLDGEIVEQEFIDNSKEDRLLLDYFKLLSDGFSEIEKMNASDKDHQMLCNINLVKQHLEHVMSNYQHVLEQQGIKMIQCGTGVINRDSVGAKDVTDLHMSKYNTPLAAFGT
jgi:hypothetical protein